MGLAERRAAKEFETKKFPEIKKQIAAAAGFEPAMEVKWETLAQDGYAHLYDDAWTKVYFAPIVEAFKAICVDAMGADALKAGVKKIVIQNSTGIYSGSSWAKFEGGVLTLDHEPVSNIDDVQQRAEGLQKVLEAAL